jgi:hypothetical protein
MPYSSGSVALLAFQLQAQLCVCLLPNPRQQLCMEVCHNAKVVPAGQVGLQKYRLCMCALLLACLLTGVYFPSNFMLALFLAAMQALPSLPSGVWLAVVV